MDKDPVNPVVQPLDPLWTITVGRLPTHGRAGVLAVVDPNTLRRSQVPQTDRSSGWPVPCGACANKNVALLYFDPHPDIPRGSGRMTTLEVECRDCGRFSLYELVD